MSIRKRAVIVLAAGLGTRMKSDLPKVLHPVAGRPMVQHLLATIETLSPDRVVVVVGPETTAVADAVAPHPTVIQQDRLGTAHAVLAAREHLTDFDGDVLVVFGDTPLITAQTLEAMLAARNSAADPAVVVLGFEPDDPGAYGRLVVEGGVLKRIVEFKDASDTERAIGLCNSGVMAFDGKLLPGLLDRIDNKNAKGEYYLTDAVALARGGARNCAVVLGGEEELLGVNSRVELAEAEAIAQATLREKAMAGGATLIDPRSVYFAHDTVLGCDVLIEPNVFFGPNVVIGDGVTIHAFSHLEGAQVAAGGTVGPFARLRPGAALAEGAKVGNFVEIKKAQVEAGAKVNHLTYIGDARIGAGANIGAGTITCNYDGFLKSHTDIGAGAFIGSNSALVAPVSIGDGAIIGAGSVISKDVPADSIAVTRAPQQDLPGRAGAFRAARKAEKERRKKKG